jgi:chromosome segregation ATPase
MHSETAPKDGKSVLLDEEDATRKSDAAPGKDHLPQGPALSFFLSQRATASDVIASRSVALVPVTAAVGAQTTLDEVKHAARARWRFAATLLATSLVAAAVTGMYFRAKVTYEGAQLRKAADVESTGLQQERDRSAALASELATVRHDFDTMADEEAQLRKAADAKLAELEQERDRSAALASELATVRHDFDTMADEEAQLRKVAGAKAAELEQERDRSAALASELATVRHDFDTMAALSSKAADEVAQLRKVAGAKAAELQQERDRSAALASELATVRHDFDTMAAMLRKAGDEVTNFKQAAKKGSAELRQSLQKEQERADTLAQELAMARARIYAVEAQVRQASEQAAELKQAADSAAKLQKSLEQEQERTTRLEQDVAAARREVEKQTALAATAGEEARQMKQAAADSAAELQTSLRQEQERTARLEQDVAAARRDLEKQSARPAKASRQASQATRRVESSAAGWYRSSSIWDFIFAPPRRSRSTITTGRSASR